MCVHACVFLHLHYIESYISNSTSKVRTFLRSMNTLVSPDSIQLWLEFMVVGLFIFEVRIGFRLAYLP